MTNNIISIIVNFFISLFAVIANKREALVAAAKTFASTKKQYSSLIEVKIDKEEGKTGFRIVRRSSSPATEAAMREVTPLYFPKENITACVSTGVLSVDYSAADKKAAKWAAIRYLLVIKTGDSHQNEFVTVLAQLSHKVGKIGLDSFLDLSTGKKYLSVEAAEEAFGISIDQLPSYGGKKGGQVVTASAQKESRTLLLRNNTPEYVNALNEVNMRMLTSQLGQEKTAPELIKFAGRLGMQASGEQFGRDIPVHSVAVYIGKYWGGAADGQAYTSLFGMGYAAQARSYTAKCQVIGYGDSLGSVINTVNAKGVVTYVRGTDPALKSQIEDALNGVKNDLEGFIVVICNDEAAAIELFGDLNAFKAAWDIDMVSGMNIIEMFHDARKDPEVSFSQQSVSKLLAAVKDDPAALKQVLSVIMDLFRKNIADKFIVKATKFDSAADFVAFLYKDAIQALASIDVSVMNRFPWLKRRLLVNVLNALTTCIDKLSIKVEGAYLVAQCDPGIMFGQQILKYNEFLVGDERLAKKETFIVLKDPSMGENEFIKGRPVSKEEYKARVKNLVDYDVISKEDGKLLCDYVEFFNPAAILISADPRVKRVLAGLDFDADHLRVITEKKIVDLFARYVKSVEVVIDTTPIMSSDTRKYRVGYDVAGVAQVLLDQMEILSIGQVTNLWTLIQTMHINNDTTNFKKFVVNVLGNKGNKKGAYKPFCVPTQYLDGLYTVKISKDIIDKMILAAQNMELSEENLRAALTDFVVAIPRHDQEVIIDAPKHGYDYHVLGSKHRERAFIKFYKSVTNGDEPILLTVVVNEDKSTADIKVLGGVNQVWGIIKDLKHEMAVAAIAGLREDVRKAFSKPIVLEDREIMEACSGTYASLSSETKDELGRLVRLGLNVAGAYKYMVNSTMYEQDDANNAYSNLLQYIEADVRRVTAKLTGSQRIEALLAMTVKENVGGKGVLQGGLLAAMGRTIFREEFAEYIINASRKEFGFEFAANDFITINPNQVVVGLYAESKPGVAGGLCKSIARLNGEKAKAAVLHLVEDGYRMRIQFAGTKKPLSYLVSGFSGKAVSDLRKRYAGKNATVECAHYCGVTNSGYVNAILVLNIQ